MKKLVFILVGTFSFLIIGFSNRVYAQGYFTCGNWFGDPCTVLFSLCESGFMIPPGDQCRVYYQANGSCPPSLECVAEGATPTPTVPPGVTPTMPPPTPTESPFGCPNQYYGKYCDDVTNTLVCRPDQFCDSTQAPPPPAGCTGVCVSLTPIPTVTPAGGSTIPVYDPGCTTDNGQEGVKSALGCLPTNPERFTNIALPWAIGIGAGIAFLLGVFGATMITLSAGNPEKMQAGKEMITSAIAGLLLIIFAMFILRVVGVDILKLFLFEEPGHPGGGGT